MQPPQRRFFKFLGGSLQRFQQFGLFLPSFCDRPVRTAEGGGQSAPSHPLCQYPLLRPRGGAFFRRQFLQQRNRGHILIKLRFQAAPAYIVVFRHREIGGCLTAYRRLRGRDALIAFADGLGGIFQRVG